MSAVFRGATLIRREALISVWIPKGATLIRGQGAYQRKYGNQIISYPPSDILATNSLEEYYSGNNQKLLPKMCGFDVENNSEVINYQIDEEFREWLNQVSSETDIDEYIDFDTEDVTSLQQMIR